MAKLSIETEEDRQRETRRKKRHQQRQAAERKLLEELAEEHLTDDELTDEQREEFTAMFDEWEPGFFYEDGKRIEYNGSVYQVNPGHGHTSQNDWRPDQTPALFRTVYQTTATDPETGEETPVAPDWNQPTGGHDAYQTGDKVHYDGQVWESQIDANTTVPDGDEPHNRWWKPLD